MKQQLLIALVILFALGTGCATSDVAVVDWEYRIRWEYPRRCYRVHPHHWGCHHWGHQNHRVHRGHRIHRSPQTHREHRSHLIHQEQWWKKIRRINKRDQQLQRQRSHQRQRRQHD